MLKDYQDPKKKKSNPKFFVGDSESIPWTNKGMPQGIEYKHLGGANGFVLELYKIAPNTVLPDHLHVSPEFLFVLEGKVFQDEKPVPSGWSVIAESGTEHRHFYTGDKGARTITVYGTDTQFL